MKILMLTWEYPPRIVGGIARVVEELSKKLVEMGHDVTVITYREGDAKYFEEEKTGVKVYRVDTPVINSISFTSWVLELNFNMIETANKILQKEKFDIIHSHDWLTAFAGKTLKQSFNIPLIATIHATEYGRNGGIHTKEQKYINDIEWLLTYEAQKIIVNSNFMKTEAARIFNTSLDKINVISNGIDLDKFDNFHKDLDFRRNYARDNEKIILSMARIVNEKGLQFLIGAMPKIIANYNDVKLVIAGQGPMLDELKRIAYNVGVSDRVYFTGYLKGDAVQKMYKNADVAVFPSTYEPFGIVALEGMLAEIPTVVSDVGGLNEIVEHGLTGLKSYAGNSNSIADSVLQILKDENLAKRIAKNGRKEVLDNYSWTQIAESTIETYKEGIEIFEREQEEKEKEKQNEQIEQNENKIEKYEEKNEINKERAKTEKTLSDITKEKIKNLLQINGKAAFES